MSLPKADQPAFLIVAGPNGSGKSSAYLDTDIEAGGRSVWIVNPDLLTTRIRDVERLSQREANLAAVMRIEAWLDASIEVHKTVGVETVLSTGKYRRLVEKAKSHGFAIWLLYVVLDSPERNIERVRLRVRKGGHDVPEDKIAHAMQSLWLSSPGSWIKPTKLGYMTIVERSPDASVKNTTVSSPWTRVHSTWFWQLRERSRRTDRMLTLRSG